MASPCSSAEDRPEASTIGIVWWDRLSHVEFQVNGTMYQVVYGGFLRQAEAARREQKASTIPTHSFWRLTLKVEREALDMLIQDIAHDNLTLMPDFCCGNIGQILDRYFPEHSVPFWRERTPTLLVGYLAPKASKIERFSADNSDEPMLTTRAYVSEGTTVLMMAATIVFLPALLITLNALSSNPAGVRHA